MTPDEIRMIRLTVVRDDDDEVSVEGFYPNSKISIGEYVCVHAAYYYAVRGLVRPTDLVDLRDLEGRHLPAMPDCRVPKSGDPWEAHSHTHRQPVTLWQLPPRPNEYCRLDHALCNTDTKVPGHTAARAAVAYFDTLVQAGLVDRFCGTVDGPGGSVVILDG